MQYVTTEERVWSTVQDAPVPNFDADRIWASCSCDPSRIQSMFLASKARLFGGSTTGSEDCLLKSQGHSCEIPPTKLYVCARVVEEMEIPKESHC